MKMRVSSLVAFDQALFDLPLSCAEFARERMSPDLVRSTPLKVAADSSSSIHSPILFDQDDTPSNRASDRSDKESMNANAVVVISDERRAFEQPNVSLTCCRDRVLRRARERDRVVQIRDEIFHHLGRSDA
jgi:hypothetical protein